MLRRTFFACCIVVGFASAASAAVENAYVACASANHLLATHSKYTKQSAEEAAKKEQDTAKYSRAYYQFITAAYGVDGYAALKAFGARVEKDFARVKTDGFKTILESQPSCNALAMKPAFADNVSKGKSLGSFVAKCAGASQAMEEYLKTQPTPNEQKIATFHKINADMAGMMVNFGDSQILAQTAESSKTKYLQKTNQEKSQKAIDAQLKKCAVVPLLIINYTIKE